MPVEGIIVWKAAIGREEDHGTDSKTDKCQRNGEKRDYNRSFHVRFPCLQSVLTSFDKLGKKKFHWEHLFYLLVYLFTCILLPIPKLFGFFSV